MIRNLPRGMTAAQVNADRKDVATRVGKELFEVFAYGARELTGIPHPNKRCHAHRRRSAGRGRCPKSGR